MNVWYIHLTFLAAVFLGLVLCGVTAALCGNAVVKKKPLRLRFISLVLSMVYLTVAILFTSSHGTYVRFNDWWVSWSGMDKVIERYGEPDIGEYTSGKSGRAGYYIYTDDGPIMPDHLEHFYYIEYDAEGNVTEVSDGVRPGG